MINRVRRRLGLIAVGVWLVVVGSTFAVPHGGTQVFLPLVLRSLVIATTTNLPVSYATYIGDTGNDQAKAVDVDLAGNIVLGGVFVGSNPVITGIMPGTLLGGGDGAVVRLAASGQAVSVTRIGASVVDLEVAADGRIVVCGSFGVAVLSADASASVWNDSSHGAVKRCAIGSDGTVAAAVNNLVYVYNAAGIPTTTISTGATTGDQDAFDMAVFAPNQAVIVTGYQQKTSTLQVAFLRAWNYSGAAQWTSYDFSASAITAANLGADTRGKRVAVGRDGNIYFAGSINGGTGASIFARDPKNIGATLGNREVKTDNYNTATNVGSISMVWYGRYNPINGALLKGQSALTRLDNGNGNSLGIKSITADEAGRVYLVGDAYYQMQNRAARQVAGITVGSYAGGEGYLWVASADLTQRHIWTPFTAPGVSAGGSAVQAVAVRNGVVALVSTVSSGKLITTVGAAQPTPSTLPDGYLAIWRQ